MTASTFIIDIHTLGQQFLNCRSMAHQRATQFLVGYEIDKADSAMCIKCGLNNLQLAGTIMATEA